MSEKLNVLVLGVGGNVGQGILKALAVSSLDLRIVAACTSTNSVGLYNADRAYLSPQANSPVFLKWILDICLRERINAVLTGVEPVLDVLVKIKDDIYSRTGAICLVGNSVALEIGADKLVTSQWLMSNGLGYPKFAASEDDQAIGQLVEDVGFPLIGKPRKGKGSYGVSVLKNQNDLAIVRKFPGYVIQELLGDDESEFTVATFVDKQDFVNGIIVFKRSLSQGTTVSAEAGLFPLVRAEANKIAQLLKPRGPCNMQFRLHNGKPICFEINVRFSGTTPFRARLGFNDVESNIRHFILGEPVKELPVIDKGHIFRYWNEVYVDESAVKCLKLNNKLSDPKKYIIKIEDYGITKCGS